MPVSHVVKDIDNNQPGKWYDLSCGSPTGEKWHNVMPQHPETKQKNNVVPEQSPADKSGGLLGLKLGPLSLNL